MNPTVNAALLEIKGALLARALYPAGHPCIQAGERRAAALLREILTQRQEITLFAVEERVIFDNDPLPSSESLTETLFGALRARGADRVTFRRGLAEAEIRGFLDHLGRTEASLEASAHVSYGFIREQELLPDEASRVLNAVPDSSLNEASETLTDVLGDLRDEGRYDAAILGDIVSCVWRTMRDHSQAVLPLAPLKRHDEYTFVHTINVAILSTALAEALGFDSNAAHELSIAALLHDVGKQEVPLEILNKNGKLEPGERRLIERHPVDGARILLNTPGVSELAAIVAYEHHIRADLTGYPGVPPGWKLNLAGRIVQVADVFDALRTHRPYRQGLPLPKIMDIMVGDAGSFFDADLLKIFFETVAARGTPEPYAPPAATKTAVAATP